MSAWADWIMEAICEGTALMSWQSFQASRPWMRGAVLR